MMEVKAKKGIEKIESGKNKEIDPNAVSFEDKITYDKPLELNWNNIVFWSNHYITTIKLGKKKQAKKALKIGKNNGVDYDKEKHCYVVTDKNKYYLKNSGKGFECSCGNADCVHQLALYLQLKIWTYNKLSMN